MIEAVQTQACRPEVVLARPNPECKVSVILLDWGVRESFHSLEYLNQQMVDRSSYELIWLEFYDRKPAKLREAVSRNPDLVDKWIVAGYGEDHVFNKHRLYNLGILAAEGDVCVICDSDAIFTPTFIEKVNGAFAQGPAVIHLDEVRNNSRRFYPFNYPDVKDLLGAGCINWTGKATRGLDDSPDILHEANYGACMAARRADLIAIGGADEHLDYLGYVCGPYELTFRLMNAGLPERWLRDEYLYHTWHPNTSGINSDYHGPHDGRFMSSRALAVRTDSRRVMPWVENPWVARVRQGDRLDFDEVITLLAEKEEPEWKVGRPAPSAEVYCVDRGFQGFNVFLHNGEWCALKPAEGDFDPKRAKGYRTLLQAESEYALQQLIAYYNQLPTGLWGRLWAQPAYRLPQRIWRRLGKELAQLW
jgi:hypothetical protein